MEDVTIYDPGRLYREAMTGFLQARFGQLRIGARESTRSFLMLEKGLKFTLDKNTMSGRHVAMLVARHFNLYFPTQTDDPVSRLSAITRREREVLRYLVKGLTNKEIARALDLQEVTIKLHVRGICKKLGAGNRTQAALIARENLIE